MWNAYLHDHLHVTFSKLPKENSLKPNLLDAMGGLKLHKGLKLLSFGYMPHADSVATEVRYESYTVHYSVK